MYMPTKLIVLPFIVFCFFEQCAERAGLSADIDTCLNTELGTLLQLEAERITHSYGIKFVPSIIYDGVCIIPFDSFPLIKN